MGLLSLLRKIRIKEKELRILVLGLDNAGKTTVVKKFNGSSQEDLNSISPTLGFNIFTLEFMGYRLNLWDVGGQKTLRSYWRNYFEQTDGLVWVVDSSDKLRIKDCKQELDVLLQEDRLAGASLLVFANKQDLKGSLSCKEIADALDLDRIKTRHWSIVECSAVTGTGLLEGMQFLVGDIGERVLCWGD